MFLRLAMEIFIDWKSIISPEEFYRLFLPQVKAPDWHGNNLDALNDSLVNGGINGIEPPYKIINVNIGEASDCIHEFMRSVIGIFIDTSIKHSGSEIIIK
ncbi:hypothetical protein CGI92_23500 [Vibrio parahaemolyticus]|nr:hypothetical protein CGI92_23500 [Vibrio parahaemolyticus]